MEGKEGKKRKREVGGTLSVSFCWHGNWAALHLSGAVFPMVP